MEVIAEKEKVDSKRSFNDSLSLLKDLRDFQDKFAACLDSQTDPEHTAKLEKGLGALEAISQDLLAIVEAGMKSIRRKTVSKDNIGEDPALALDGERRLSLPESDAGQSGPRFQTIDLARI